ncbi:DUF6715 family protein [Anaeromicropila populeti]|uniref:Uncharacterized protein n=1 Tax=Anaeromicropila populeti TaxID=37658 RepID=A0A1I6J3M0_9FIRM|nr:DUF6715 family protein [Anaeromicropila populeti]SFR73614.1 hypothetical protein SAMN05661086_01421 [Anaeromicropila populeti]
MKGLKGLKAIKFEPKNIVAIGILVLIVLFFYWHIDSKSSNNDTNVKSEYQLLIDKDLQNAYPETPREVVKLYSRIIKCLYNTKLKESEIDTLTGKLRVLFDEKLNEENPLDKHIETLILEIKEYKELQQTISSYIIEKDSGIDYSIVDEEEYATILAEYSLKVKSSYEKTVEKFLLRKDSEGSWKIVGWSLADLDEIEVEE